MDETKTLTTEQVAALVYLKLAQVDLQRLEIEAGRAHRAYMEANDTVARARTDVFRATERWEAISDV